MNYTLTAELEMVTNEIFRGALTALIRSSGYYMAVSHSIGGRLGEGPADDTVFPQDSDRAEGERRIRNSCCGGCGWSWETCSPEKLDTQEQEGCRGKEGREMRHWCRRAGHGREGGRSVPGLFW